MFKWIFVLLLGLCFSLKAEAEYNESVCILIKNQMNDYSFNQLSRRYRDAKKQYNKHCTMAVKTLSKNTKQLRLSNTTAEAEPVEVKAQSKVTDTTYLHQTQNKITKKAVVQNTEGYRYDILGLLLVMGVVLIVVKKRQLKQDETELSNPIEPKFGDKKAVPESELKKTIRMISQDKTNHSGLFGEALVNDAINILVGRLNSHSSLPFTQYKNVLLTNDEDELTEIDHLIVGPTGIFVIESKNYSGFIFGSEKQAKWTQVLKNTKKQFMNPLRQNYKHCLAVTRLLGVIECVESLIIFHDKAAFKTKMPENVIYLSQLRGFFAQNKPAKFTLNQLEEFNKRLARVIELTTQNDYQQHIQELKHKHGN